MNRFALAAALLLVASPALGGASKFTLVNGTAGALSDVSIRRAGTQDWKTLGAAAASGAQAPVDFKDEDCAFDLRAKVNGAPITWADINLCGVKSVTLKHDDSAGPWVDYDH